MLGNGLEFIVSSLEFARNGNDWVCIAVVREGKGKLRCPQHVILQKILYKLNITYSLDLIG